MPDLPSSSPLGAIAGDLALGARGGVHIAGGIAEKIEEFLTQSPFRCRFEGQRPVDALCRGNPYQLDRAARSGIMLAPAASK